jgi:ABC-type multidrug transport system ATPase subunit
MPQLIVNSDQYRAVFDVQAPDADLGRGNDNDVVLPLPFISHKWAHLEREGADYRFTLVSGVNATFLNDKQVTSARLRPGDLLKVGSLAQPAATIRYVGDDAQTVIERRPRVAPRPLLPALDLRNIDAPVTIGRRPGATLVLDDLQVSRQHAVITREGDLVRIEDQHSSNGVFVNGQRIRSRRLEPDDVIRIGPYRLVLDGTVLHSHDDRRRVRLDAVGVTRKIHGKVILDEITLSVLPGQKFAIAGSSGAGKSTLMDALNGSRPPDGGRVRINGTDLYESFDAVQPLLGYTPQRDIVHQELSVRGALLYSARLRLPSDVSDDEASARVDHVLGELGLCDVRDLEIRKLSGGQLKRVSIASELLANPGLLFMDEPTTGLDPGLSRKLMEVVDQLAAAGHTVVLVTHDVASLAGCDRMVFLAQGGRVAFVGSPREALAYFEVDDLAGIYTRVESEQTPEWWQRRFRESSYGRRVLPQGDGDDDGAGWDRARVASPRGRHRSSFFRQFRALAQRRAEILFRDRRNLLLLLAQAPAIGVLLALVFSRNAFDPLGALAADTPDRVTIGHSVPPGALASALPLVLAATATWLGAINAAREVVRELPILSRERGAGLRVLPYIASKMAVLSVLAAVQVAMLLGVVLLKVRVPMRGEFTYGAVEIYATLLLTALAAEALGLLISSAVSNPDRAQSLVPIILIPQIIFVGGPLATRFSYLASSFTITRWSIEAMKISLQVPYRGHAGFDATDLLLRWGVLLSEACICLAAAALLARNKKAKAS